jgi:hypothetical protein
MKKHLPLSVFIFCLCLLFHYGHTENYTLTPNPFQNLELKSPKAGIVWAAGVQYRISWNSTNVQHVNLFYSMDNGSTWVVMKENFESTDGYSDYGLNTYNWTVPDTLENTYKQSMVKIEDAMDPQVFVVSPSFTLTAAHFKFIRPQANDVYTVGKDDYFLIEIESRSDLIFLYSLTLSTIDHESAHSTSFKIYGAGTYSHQFPFSSTLPSGEYFFILKYYSYESESTESIISPVFIVINNIPSLEIGDPNKNSVWTAENRTHISWRSHKVEKVNFYYSLDDGYSWILIAEDIESRDGISRYNNFKWIVSENIDKHYPKSLFRVEDAMDPGIYAISSQFLIRNNPVSFLHPTAQTTVAIGQKLEILFELEIDQQLDITCRNNEGQEFQLPFGWNESAGEKKYRWEVSHELSPGNYNILVFCLSESIMKRSETFTIVPAETKVDATFRLDMTHVKELDPSLHNVYLTGEFTDWAVPAASIIMLPEVENPGFYTATKPLAPGNYAYKYFSDIYDKEWNGGEWEGKPDRYFNVNSNTEINDIWGLHPDVYFSLTFNIEPHGSSGTVMSGNEKYHALQQVDVYAEASEGYRFAAWKNAEGNIISNEPEFTFSMPARHTMLTALFEETTGVEESGNLTTNIFPNPATDDVTISMGEVINELMITDIRGNIILHQSVGNTEVRVNSSEWHGGMYLVHIKTSESQVVRKLVVQ